MAVSSTTRYHEKPENRGTEPWRSRCVLVMPDLHGHRPPHRSAVTRTPTGIIGLRQCVPNSTRGAPDLRRELNGRHQAAQDRSKHWASSRAGAGARRCARCCQERSQSRWPSCRSPGHPHSTSPQPLHRPTRPVRTYCSPVRQKLRERSIRLCWTSWTEMSKSPSCRFPVTGTQLPVTRCEIRHRTRGVPGRQAQ